MSADNKGQEPAIDTITVTAETTPQTMGYIGAVALIEEQQIPTTIPVEAPRAPLSGRALPYFVR